MEDATLRGDDSPLAASQRPEVVVVNSEGRHVFETVGAGREAGNAD